MRSSLLCFAHGNNDGWEAICVDLDIAVQGRSFSDVRTSLERAVELFAAEAQRETPAQRARLLSRRAPWHIVAWLTFKLVSFNLLRGRQQEAQASFPVACPA